MFLQKNRLTQRSGIHKDVFSKKYDLVFEIFVFLPINAIISPKNGGVCKITKIMRY
jgi:hypothetical protein